MYNVPHITVYVVTIAPYPGQTNYYPGDYYDYYAVTKSPWDSGLDSERYSTETVKATIPRELILFIGFVITILINLNM